MSRATRRSPTGRARATTRRRLRPDLEAEARPNGSHPILIFTALALVLILALGVAASWGPAGSVPASGNETRAVEVHSQATASKPVEDYEENYESGYSDN